MLKKIVLGQLRHLMGSSGAGLATWLLSHGASPADTEVILSAVVAVASALWSIYDKYQQAKAIKQAEKEGPK